MEPRDDRHLLSWDLQLSESGSPSTKEFPHPGYRRRHRRISAKDVRNLSDSPLFQSHRKPRPVPVTHSSKSSVTYLATRTAYGNGSCFPISSWNLISHVHEEINIPIFLNSLVNKLTYSNFVDNISCGTDHSSSLFVRNVKHNFNQFLWELCTWTKSRTSVGSGSDSYW